MSQIDEAIARTCEIPRPTGESYSTKQEVANVFSVTTRTVDAWMRDGKIPYFKIGRTVRFSLSDIRAYLEQNFRK